MKKCLFVIAIVAIFMATGCGKKQLVCVGTAEEDGVKMTGTVTADLNAKDNVTDAVIVYEFNSKEAADQYCSVFKVFEEEDKDIKISCSGNKITMKGFAKIISEYDDSLIGASREDFIKAMEENKYTCE